MKTRFVLSIIALVLCALIHFFPQFVIAFIIIAAAIVIFVDWLFDKDVYFTDEQKLKGHGRSHD